LKKVIKEERSGVKERVKTRKKLLQTQPTHNYKQMGGRNSFMNTFFPCETTSQGEEKVNELDPGHWGGFFATHSSKDRKNQQLGVPGSGQLQKEVTKDWKKRIRSWEI